LDNGEDQIYALAAFYDYPNIHGVPSNDWENKWLRTQHGTNVDISTINANNTLFLHFFVAHPDFSEGCAKELINVTFKAMPEVNQILLCVPHQVTPGQSRSIVSSATRLGFLFVNIESALTKYFQPITNQRTDNPCSIMICHRKDHFPALFIRKAR
jgi:hypothetical protein